jgi:signal transduction histidine kinase
MSGEATPPRRPILGGIAARIALLAIAGLVGAQLLSVAVALLLRPTEVRVYSLSWLVDRSVELARGVGERPSGQRSAWLATRPETENLELVWTTAWSPGEDGMRRGRQGRIARSIAERLPEGYAVFIEMRRDRLMRDGRLPPLPAGEMVRVPREREERDGDGAFDGVVPGFFTIAIRLPDASFLVMRAQRPTEAWAWAILAAWLVGISAAAGLGAAWAARRIAAPLEDLARGAARAGAGLPPDFAVSPRAPRELGAIGAALERMHGRLRRHVDDRTRMLAAISHDLRTPLTRLRLRAESIADPEERAKATADIDEMERMIAETLAFARADALETRTERFDLAALLQTLVDTRSDLGAETVYEGEGSLVVEGRPGALKRAIGNLVDNAIAYGGRAVVRLADLDERIEVTVTDDGPGLPDAELEKVFQPFYRLEGSRSRSTGGAGLGLALARDIARAHGGDIVLANATPRGLRATLTLPRAG